MGRIGGIKHETYESSRVEQIWQILDLAARTSQKRDFEIILDGIKVVPRTSDPNVFNSFEQYITKESDCLTIYLYYGASKHADTYFFYFKGIPTGKNPNPVLSGLNREELEKQQKERLLKEIRYEKLEKENGELKAQLGELEEKFSGQQEYWEGIKNKKVDSLSDLGTAIVLKLLALPGVQNKFPGLKDMFGDLSGAPKEEATFTRKESSDNKTEEEASFSRVDKSNNTGPKLSEEQLTFLDFYDKVYKHLGKDQMEILLDILHALVNNPVALRSARKHIFNFLKNKPEPGRSAA